MASGYMTALRSGSTKTMPSEASRAKPINSSGKVIWRGRNRAAAKLTYRGDALHQLGACPPFRAGERRCTRWHASGRLMRGRTCPAAQVATKRGDHCNTVSGFLLHWILDLCGVQREMGLLGIPGLRSSRLRNASIGSG